MCLKKIQVKKNNLRSTERRLRIIWTNEKSDEEKIRTQL